MTHKTSADSYSSQWTLKQDAVTSGPLPFSLKWENYADGVDNPSHSSQIRNGENASTDFSGVKHEVRVHTEPSVNVFWTDGGQNSHSVSGSGFWNSTYGPHFADGVPDYSSADNTALGKFYSSARRVQTEFSGGTFLGELRETIQMIKHPAQGLLGLVDAMNGSYKRLLSKSSGRSHSRSSLERSLGNVYLEGVFGWLPLISDLKSAFTAYDRLINETRSSRCRGFGEELKQVLNVDGVENIYDSNSVFRYTELATLTTQVNYYGAVKAGLTGPSVNKAADLFGFRADEFLPTVWELVPYSFLIDYFANVGSIVSAACYCNANLAWCSSSKRAVYKTVRNGNFDAASSGNFSYSPAGGGKYSWETTKTYVSRVRDGQPGIPGLELSIPGSSIKWLNITALLAQSSKLSGSFMKLLR